MITRYMHMPTHTHFVSGEQLTTVQVTIKEMIQDKGNDNEQRIKNYMVAFLNIMSQECVTCQIM